MDLSGELHRAFIEAHHRPLGVARLGVELEHILHTGSVFAVGLQNAPHVFAPGLGAIFAKRHSDPAGTQRRHPPLP